MAHVFSVMTTGLIAYNLKAADYKKLGRALGRLLRPLLRGEGTWWNDQKEGLGILSYKDLRVYWWIPQTEDWLRAQRLRHLQCMVREPDVHRQTICSVFGKLEIVGIEDEATIDEAGNLKEKANGWAVRYEKDLMKPNHIEAGEELRRKIAKDGKVNIRSLFGEAASEFYESICRSSPRRSYRERFFKSCLPKLFTVPNKPDRRMMTVSSRSGSVSIVQRSSTRTVR